MYCYDYQELLIYDIIGTIYLYNIFFTKILSYYFIEIDFLNWPKLEPHKNIIFEKLLI